jgi:hypothetical protein
MEGDWVAFVNRECAALSELQPPLPKGALRGAIRERLGEALAFPLVATFRGLVAGERLDAVGTPPVVQASGLRHLEVVPEGLTREAAALVGPVLLALDRKLQAGSVLDLQVVLEDPRARDPDVPGLYAEVVEMVVVVPVEP